MLIYHSNRKIENLCSEFNIDKSLIDSIMPDKIKARFSMSAGDASGSIEGEYDFTDSNKTSKVLKKLKGKKSLIELVHGQTHIKKLSYYVCDGRMSYIKRVDGSQAKHIPNDLVDKYRGSREFFPDDKLEFSVKMLHDKFNTLNFECTADSICVFGWINLAAYHPDEFKTEIRVMRPNSGDPGLLITELPVRVIFWCLNTNESIGIINATPIMISC